MILKLDFSSDIPIYQQIRNQIVLSVADGTIRPGEKLPSMRTLAAESGINMMTVNKAYQLLKQEGYLVIDRRSGARIAIPSHEAALATLTPQLELLISEARLHGIERERFLALCGQIYSSQERRSKAPEALPSDHAMPFKDTMAAFLPQEE